MTVTSFAGIAWFGSAMTVSARRMVVSKPGASLRRRRLYCLAELAQPGGRRRIFDHAWASAVESRFLKGRALWAQSARASELFSCSSSTTSCCRSLSDASAAKAGGLIRSERARLSRYLRRLASGLRGRGVVQGRPAFWLGAQWAILRGRREPSAGGKIGRIEIVLAGNPDQGEQGIAAGIGEGST